MANESLSPVPKLQFFDNNGKPAVGYKLFTYAAQTTTKLATYTDASGLVQNSNPIVLDYRGEANVWTPPNVAYKYVFARPNDTDPPGAPIWTVDQIVNSELLTLYGGVDTGSANLYVLDFTANFASYTDGIIIYWIPSNTNNSTSTLNVNTLGPVPILNFDGSPVNDGDIVANTTVGVMYRAGAFYMLYPAVTAGSFVATFSGMDATTSGNMDYRVTNRVATLSVRTTLSGTSNATFMAISGLPQEVTGGQTYVREAVCSVINNGVRMSGYAQVSLGAKQIVFTTQEVSGSNIVSGPFANTGEKGIPFDWQITYPL